MNMILLSKTDMIQDNKFQISNERYIHINKILKKSVGDIIEAGLINEYQGKCKILGDYNSSFEIKFIERYDIINSAIEKNIICALPRPQTLKKILPLIATTGVNKLHLIKTNRVEKSFFHSPLVNEEDKIKKYLHEGMSQGKRIFEPEVKVFSKFKEYFEKEFSNTSMIEDSLFLILHPGEKENLMSLAKNQNIKKITVAIGPEGGWVPFEIDYLEKLGFKKTNLGSSILRVENAVNGILSQIELLEIL